MKTLLFYRVQGRWVQNWEEGVVMSFTEEFCNSNPIHARNAAFTYYQQKVDYLLSQVMLKNRIHKNLMDDLWTFFSAPAVGNNGPKAPWKKQYDPGIGVYCVFDDESDPDMYRSSWCIHGVGGISNMWDAGTYLIGLCYERMAYEEHRYDMGGQAIAVKYWGLEEDNETTEYNILDTPYCWNPERLY